jgi:hypothetical protein
VLISVGTAAALVTAGCNPFASTTRTTRTVVQTAPPPIDPMTNLIATTQLHLLRLQSAVAKGGSLAKTLTPLRDDRADHLDALRAELARTSPSAAAATAAPATATVAIPSEAASVLAVIRDDAGNAQVQFTDATTTVSPYRAELLASIAACLATHRAVLA